MSSAAYAAAAAREGAHERGRRPLWPLWALILLAAAVRLSSIDLQSFWFDEAFTPVYVIHHSLAATMETMSKTENTPPLWYFLIWVWTRIFGTGVIAMRLPSALFGIALVPVGWGIGMQLSGRRAAIAIAALIAFNPLLVWYSQEARAYELYALTGGLAFLCFLRAEAQPSGRRMALFALSGALALASHYFAVFLLVPMALWLLRKRQRWRVAAPAVAAIGLVGLALLPLLLAQKGNGTQWIGHWALSSRLEAIPDYYLTGYSGQPLGRGVELLVALPLIAAVIYGLWRRLSAREARGALMSLALALCGIVIPIAIIAFGADFLAPRNLIAAMIPVTAVIGIVGCARSTGRIGPVLIGLAALAFLAVCIDVNLRPRLQRGDWKGVAAVVRKPLSGVPSGQRVIATVHLGSAPLAYYVPGLGRLRKTRRVRVSEIDEVGYPPLLASAEEPPARGFRLVSHTSIEGLYDVFRFRSSKPQTVSTAALRVPRVTKTGEAINLIGPAALGNGA